ncbi:hypothetical protein CHISP_0802 [Chitinispirillum alkaliphilum]|nr:hypothetical protein CHISP_0802 [Chitinispirillum alkaliphilum]
MDNDQQIEEIRKYLRRLAQKGKRVDENSAAFLWIQKYAEKWRDTHSSIDDSTAEKNHCKKQ